MSWLSVVWGVLVLYAMWSPERFSTYSTTFLYELRSNWLSYFVIRSPFFVSTIYAVLSKDFGVVLKFMLELAGALRRMSYVTKIFPDKLSVLQSVEQNC